MIVLLANATVVIIAQYINISNQNIVHLKVTRVINQLYLD